MKSIRKYMLMLILLLICVIINNDKVLAVRVSGNDPGPGVGISAGTTYRVSYLGLKVTLINSSGKQVGDSVVFFPSNPSSQTGDIAVNVSHKVKFNRHTSYNGTPLGCYHVSNNNTHTDTDTVGGHQYPGCNMYVYLQAIKQEDDVELVKFFVNKILDTSVNISNYSSYFLMFEPYLKVETFRTEANMKYYVFGTPAETFDFVIKGTNTTMVDSTSYKAYIPYTGITTGNYIYEYAPLSTIYNTVTSISSDNNLDNNNIPVYKQSNENSFSVTGTPYNWNTVFGSSTSDAAKRKKLWYYYVKSKESALKNRSGLGVGFLALDDFVEETCASEFDDSDKSMAERIRIYEKYSSEGDYRNLLNMNITTGAKACTVKNNCNYIKQTSCLQVDLSRNYDDDDLSCYNEVIKSSGTNTPDAYCLVSFSLENKLGGNSFLTKSGSLIFSVKNKSTPGLAAQGVLKKRCYVKVNNVVDSKTYASYITGLKVEDGDKWMTLDNDVDSNGTTVNKGFRTIKYTGKYLLKRLYGKGLTGMTTYENCSNCKFLGYGIVSKFNDNIIAQETGEVVSNLFGFKLFTNFSSYFPNIVEGSCRYFAVPELIKNGKIDLQFRIIDTANPFPGKLGEGRTTGANWCDELDCGFGNKIVKKIILNANNSYNKKQEFPKYEITLTPSDIKKIREYNKNRRYDDFDFTCDKDRINCTSNFLKKLSEGSLGLSNNLIMR